ncbi:hypothetical protein GEMRC1_004190 [Eukaryota sp. GEM-RC1]
MTSSTKEYEHLLMVYDNQIVTPVRVRDYSSLDHSVTLKFKRFRTDELPQRFPASEVPKVLFLVHAIETRNMSLFFQALDEHTAVQKTLHHGWYPLHYAAEFGFVSAVEKLLEMGSCPRALSDTLQIPLTLAARRGNVRIMQLLLAAAPDSVDHTDYNGETPLFILVQRWSRLSGQLSSFKSLYFIAAAALLITYGADLDRRNAKDYMNVLHLAAQFGKHEILRLFINRCKQDELDYLLNSIDREGDTPLMLNSYKAQSKEVVKVLRFAGADVSILNLRKENAAAILPPSKKGKMVRELLECDLETLSQQNPLSPPTSPRTWGKESCI